MSSDNYYWILFLNYETTNDVYIYICKEKPFETLDIETYYIYY